MFLSYFKNLFLLFVCVWWYTCVCIWRSELVSLHLFWERIFHFIHTSGFLSPFPISAPQCWDYRCILWVHLFFFLIILSFYIPTAVSPSLPLQAPTSSLPIPPESPHLCLPSNKSGPPRNISQIANLSKTRHIPSHHTRSGRGNPSRRSVCKQAKESETILLPLLGALTRIPRYSAITYNQRT